MVVKEETETTIKMNITIAANLFGTSFKLLILRTVLFCAYNWSSSHSH
jgi:hypothetical protein